MISFIASFFVFYLNMLFSFGRKNSKQVAFLLLIVAYIFMVATNNQNGQNGDYRAYLELYNHFKYGGTISNISGYETDYVYMLLMYIVAKLNVSYNIFLMIFTLISFIFSSITLSKLTKNYNLVLLLYMIFPFFYDVIQFRFFFAYSLVIFALQFIIFEGKKNYFKYILWVIIASLIHKTVLFFLVYVLLKLKLKILIRLILLFTTVLTLVSLIFKVNIIDVLSSVLTFDKFGSYTSEAIKYNLNPIVSIVIILIILYFIFVIRIIKIKSPTYEIQQILWMNLLNILLFPFLIISLDFERFMRPILLINYAIIAEYNKYLSRKTRILLFLSLLIVLGFRLFLMIGFIEMAFENNYIFQYLNGLFK